ncbi:MAG: sugar phosphate nucleotidyltransferase [Bacteroidota bacterium]
MKLVIPMAGRGTRLRPHTHVTPKPLLPVLGISMVERIVETFIRVLPKKLEAGVFVLGPDFPEEVYEQLREICSRHGMAAEFAVQERALGTAHAVYAAHEYLDGEAIVVFADTLFDMEPGVDLEGADVVAWTKWVEDPRRFGVVLKDGDRITDFVEKPKEIISHDALIGIYFVREAAQLRDAIAYLIENEITGHGEYQLTDAFDHMLKDDKVFKTTSVTEWLDAGTIPALKDTSYIILNKETDRLKQGESEDSVLIEPVYIGEGARVVRSVVGPNVVIEAGATVSDAILKNTIVFGEATVANAVLDDAVIGHHATVDGRAQTLNVGDHSVVRA